MHERSRSPWRLLASLLAMLATAPFSSMAWSNGREAKRATEAKALGEVLAGNEELSTYYSLIKQNPDILLQLPHSGGVTLIAPSNEAFNKSHVFDLTDSALVTSLLQYHILPLSVNVSSLEPGPTYLFPTLLTSSAYTNVTKGQNILTSRQHDDTAVITSGLGTRSTILEPPFQDIPFTGGFIQVVDTLLVPPSRLETTARDAYKDLTSFLGALFKSGLAPDLSSQRDITILAPRNAAFQSISSALDPLSKEDLATVLKYHIIPDKVLSSSDLSSLANSTGSSLATLLGSDDKASKVTVSKAGNNIFFNSAQLLQSDVLLANGVIHIIDNVLNPDEFAETPDLEAKSQTPVFQVSKGAETRTGTRVPAPFTTWLPCTTDCPEPTVEANTQRTATTTGRNGVNSQSSSGMGAQVTAAAAILGAVGMGVIGLGAM
ncbi:FAS1 domain-containing protein [Triangularia verruculosa]|uniref:FAS1 domain-containing protein n=1 Tax=Triangularia verruculosa TaxID=2587418 RepID=A0AAN7AQM7_9PEZI|nr:FAS1 domain-containing protein [Triangularia verruculosa]